MYSPRSLLITGGAGFIGSYVVNRSIKYLEQGITIVVLDRLDYCSRLDNWSPRVTEHPNFKFYQGDIADVSLVSHILNTHSIDTVLHLAAMSHVDTSFGNSIKFTMDNALGTHYLLEACRVYGGLRKFIHISTDEVMGDIPLDSTTPFTEDSLLKPTNPYAASKACAEMICSGYYHSYKLPIVITRGNNVYGRYQHVEKLIPKFIVSLLSGKKCTIHGNGVSRRNFIHGSDTARAMFTVMHEGVIGETYNIGTHNEYSVMEIFNLLASKICPEVDPESLKTYVLDRPFNDVRYFISSDKLRSLGWTEKIKFEDGLNDTIQWYRDNLEEYTGMLETL